MAHELRQEDPLKFDVSLGYIMSSRPEWDTQQEPTSNNFWKPIPASPRLPSQASSHHPCP